MQFDMNTAWQRAMDLVQANIRLLAVIAGVFFLLPTLILNIAFPEMANANTAIDTTSDDPTKVWAQMAEFYGPILPWSLLAAVTSFVGYCTMVGLMGAKGVTVGEAIMRGVKAVPSLIAVTFLFFIAYIILVFIILIPVFILGAILGMISGALAGIVGFLGGLAAVLSGVLLIGRFCVTMPVIVLEGTLNPIAAMQRSWKLTAPRQWAITGFWALLGIVYSVIALLLTAVISLLAALASGTVSALITGLFSGLIGVVFAILISGLAAAIYQQLTSDGPSSISETFS